MLISLVDFAEIQDNVAYQIRNPTISVRVKFLIAI